MMTAIKKGYCLLGKSSFNEYYNNKIPARDEAKQGTKGTKQFVIDTQSAEWANLMEHVDI
jgi:hypothetical protein